MLVSFQATRKVIVMLDLKQSAHLLAALLLLVGHFGSAAIAANPPSETKTTPQTRSADKADKNANSWETPVGLSLFLAQRIHNSTGRPYYYYKIVMALIEARDFKQALVVANKIDRSDFLKSIAFALAEAGEIKPTLEVVKRIANTSVNYEDVLYEITSSLAREGVFKPALVLAEKIHGKQFENRVRYTVSMCLSQKGDFDEAVIVANEITNDENEKTSALSNVVFDLSQAGKAEQALDVANSMETENPYSKDRVLRDVAKALIKAGKFKQALEIVNRTENRISRYKAMTLFTIARALAKAGGVKEAISAAQQMDDLGFSSSKTLAACASELVETGDTKRAMEIARVILEPKERATTLSAIANAHAKAGNKKLALTLINQATELAQKIEGVEGKASVLSTIAAAQMEAGDKVESRKTLKQAIELIENIEEGKSKVGVLRSVCEALVKAGDSKQAVRIANKIQGASYDQDALAHVSLALAKAGNI
jgi:tetratricopeptide (TPR) repeat protein